jgi:hypothetical protein
MGALAFAEITKALAAAKAVRGAEGDNSDAHAAQKAAKSGAARPKTDPEETTDRAKNSGYNSNVI